MNAVPVDDLVGGDGWWRAVLPPRDVVLGDDAPRAVILTVHISSHVAKLDVVGGVDVLRRQITNVVRLAEIIPGQDLNDVGLHLIVTRDLLEAVGE